MAKRQPRRAKAPNDIVALARAHTQAAIDTLVEIMTGADAPPATRLSAANALLERAFGKPAQPEGDGRDDLKPVSELSMEELMARVARILAEPDREGALRRRDRQRRRAGGT